MTSTIVCVFPDCTNPAAMDASGHPDEGGLCSGHAKQKRRKRDLRPLRRRRHPKATLAEAALQYADASPEQADRAWHRLRMAARRYVLTEKRKGRPPAHAK